jgi:MraZ protein
MEPTGPQGDEQGGTVASLHASASPAAPAFGHAAFSGNVAARLEPTGRLAIPAAYRHAFSGQARMRAYRREYLMLWTDHAFDLVATTMATKGGLIDPQARKNLYRATQPVAVDRQGRLVIPPDLRERVGLTDQVVVVGSIESLEIYSAEAFERLTALDDADLFFDTFDGLPTDPA